MTFARLLRRGAFLVVAIAVIYVAGAGYLFFKVAERLLSVGTIGAILADAERPDTPTDLGYRGDPSAAFGYAFGEIAIESELGANPAWLVPPEPAGTIAAIYVHGIAGAREDGYRYLPMLREARLPVLLISYRNDPGAPASPDNAYAFGLAEWRDLEAAADWWTVRGVERLVIVGESMGGGIVGQWLARTDHAASVVGIALDSPALSFRRVLDGLVAARGLPAPGLVARAALLWQAAVGRRDMRGAEVEDVLTAFPGPVFLAHGTGDAIVPADISRDLAASRSGRTISLVTSADHLGSWAEDPETYRDAFRRFLAEATR